MIPYLLISRTYGLHVGIFTLISGLLLSAISSNKWVLDTEFENNQDTSELLWEKNGISLITCGSLCDRNPSCFSFFYHASLMKCLGSQSYKRGLPAGQTMLQEWKYYPKPQHCDGDYAYNQTLGLCYKVHNEQKNHSYAMALCESEGAKLIIIRNEIEFQHIQSLAYLVAPPFAIWIGLRAMGANMVWKWWNGQADPYVRWNGGRPDNSGGNQRCVTICERTYRDDDCDILRGFVYQRYI